jgi:YidC/Oxa1 family membrane protein insertase
MLVAANIFQPLIDVFESVLKFFHGTGFSWGWSIVLLTVLVRAVLMPLTFKQFHSMQKLQRLQPEFKAIQAKYKDDKQRQQQELMKLYSEHGVNPFASCLPLVAQFPVFISLYYMLRQSLRKDICPQVQLKYHLATHAPIGHTVPCGPHNGASFLFIPDLTNRAYGAVLIALMVLYVGTQLISSLMMSSPTMDRNQRMLIMFMPLVFVFIMIGFPAGVIVYWITTNVWTIGQQYIVRRTLGPMGPVAPAADGDEAEKGAGATPAVAKSAAAEANGSDEGGGGLAGMLRGRRKPDQEPAAVGAGSRRRTGPPPPPPRKKKKRSGRRR